MQEIRLDSQLDDEAVEELIGTKLPDHGFYDQLITNSARVYAPNGDPLLVYAKGAIPASLGAKTFNILNKGHMIHRGKNNRGTASRKINGRATTHALKQDGSVSKTNFNPEPTRSGIVGFFNREARFPYCRRTAFLEKYPKDWQALQPFIRKVNQTFAENLPERYAVQKAVADATNSAWVIKDTAFTTLTVNHDWQTACHRDAGDLPEGFGVMACLRAGSYAGGYLVMPKYRIAVDMQSCDVLLFDVHQIHGNTPIHGREGAFRRITSVFYYRKNICYCGTPEQEAERAKFCRERACLHDPEEIKRGEQVLAAGKALAVP